MIWFLAGSSSFSWRDVAGFGDNHLATLCMTHFSHLEEIVADKSIFDFIFQNFVAKYQKVCEISLGQTWHEMKKLGKWGTFVLPGLPMTAVKICVENFFTYSLRYGKFAIQIHEWFLSVFTEEKFDKVCTK